MREPNITVSLTPNEAMDIEHALVVRGVQLNQQDCARKAAELLKLSEKIWALRREAGCTHYPYYPEGKSWRDKEVDWPCFLLGILTGILLMSPLLAQVLILTTGGKG